MAKSKQIRVDKSFYDCLEHERKKLAKAWNLAPEDVPLTKVSKSLVPKIKKESVFMKPPKKGKKWKLIGEGEGIFKV